MLNTYNIKYLLFKVYDFFLLIYILLIDKYNLLYKKIHKKIYNSSNLVYIFNNEKFTCKEYYNNYVKMKELRQFIKENNNYFIIHSYEIQDVNYISNNYLLNTINSIKTNYTFILIEIESKNSKIDITNFINNPKHYHYLVGNILFNKNFMVWLMHHKFNINIHDYIINIIDNNINNISLDKNKYIKLYDNTYTIEE